MQKTILSVIALTLFGLANAQVKSFGACPNVSAQSNFELSKFMGTFYEYARYPFAFEGNGKCTSVSRTQISETKYRRLLTTVNPTTNKKTIVTGTANLISNGKLQVKYDTATNLRIVPRIVLVLSTDYASYAVTYACEPTDGNSHNTYVWIFTRERRPSYATIEKAKNVLTSNGILLAPLTVVDQSNC